MRLLLKLIQFGATCTVCNVLHGLSRGQKNEQQNNVPTPKNNAAAGYQGPVKIELSKGAGRSTVNFTFSGMPEIVFARLRTNSFLRHFYNCTPTGSNSSK